MNVEYRKADIADAELLIEIYNSAFYSDYIKYGECPAYGKTKEMMEKSIINYPIMPNQRAVLLLSFFKEYSDMDIARLMKISHKTVAYRKQMAMKKLRILLEGTEDGR